MNSSTLALSILLLLVVCSGAYQALCLFAAWDFKRSKPSAPSSRIVRPPRLSILKPVRGLDDLAHECWSSFCNQDYPDYELLFGFHSPDDPGIPLVERLKIEFPNTDIKLVVNSRTIGLSGKVGNLHNMAEVASGEVLVLSDSDIRVGREYLRTVAASLENPEIGLVTCPYRAVGSETFAALMESFGISGEFMPGALVSRRFEGMKFAFGSTIAIRRSVLERIGGFRTVADSLADDYLLGNLSAASGCKVELSRYTVETVVPAYRFSEFWTHQLRWARCVRYSRPGGYAGMFITYTAVFAALTVVSFSTSPLAWAAAGTALLLRLAVGWTVGVKLLGDERLKRRFWLLPVRDGLGFLIWAAGLFGDTIEWRGDRFRLVAGGKLVSVTDTTDTFST